MISHHLAQWQRATSCSFLLQHPFAPHQRSPHPADGRGNHYDELIVHDLAGVRSQLTNYAAAPGYLTLLGRDTLDLRGEAGMRCGIDWPMSRDMRRCILSEEIFITPISRRPDRSRHESTSAIGTNILEHSFDTLRTEGAFERANPRLGRFGRKRLFTILAKGPELEHPIQLRA